MTPLHAPKQEGCVEEVTTAEMAEGPPIPAPGGCEAVPKMEKVLSKMITEKGAGQAGNPLMV